MRRLVLIAVLLHPVARNVVDDSRENVIPADRFIDDMRRKDITDIMAIYSPDALFIDTRGTRFKGASQLRALFESAFATYDVDELTFSSVLTVISGPMGSEAVIQDGLYSELLRTRADDAVRHLCGEYRVTYVRRPASARDDVPAIFKDKKPIWLISDQRWASSPCPA